MIVRLDRALDGITMYRLVLYVLASYVAVATILAGFGLLPFVPLQLLGSVALLLVMCWAANTILGRIFAVPTNIESAAITALILALIVDPAASQNGVQLLGWAAILAMASKYIVTLRQTHLFNPAAVAVVVTSFALGESASWWVGTGAMLPAVLLGGLLIVRKLGDERMVAMFLVVALVTVSLVSVVLRLPIPRELQQLVVESPLFFFGSIMLIEPVTAPATKRLKLGYAALVGFLFVPQIHIGALYSTPELALLVGNGLSFVLKPRQTVVLRPKRRGKLAPDIMELTFTPSHALAFEPGQYVEVTLAHRQPDSRGNRRFFTIASSPTENLLRLGVRFSKPGSSFKRALLAIGANTRITAQHVAGDFTLPRDPRQKMAFIAGGIGITPFRSMLKYLLDTKQRRDIVLLYANRAPGEIVYRDVLSEAQTKLGVKIAYTLTDRATVPRDWSGYTGRIDARMIRGAVPDYGERIFYLSGPPTMVRAHAEALKALGVSRSNIKTDAFSGLG
jgi:ferredoxin-NADP reductase/Na+-translocating ferredoxin:NAD+ oxidoreductase RnfD subunit